MRIEYRGFCRNCGLEFPVGLGGYFYIEVDRELLLRRLQDIEYMLGRLREYYMGIKDLISEFKVIVSKLHDSSIKSLIERLDDVAIKLEERMLDISIFYMDVQYYFRYIDEEGLNNLRIRCPPGEEANYIRSYLGHLDIEEVIKRVGFNSFCICLECLHQFEADLRDEESNPFRHWIKGPPAKDSRICPVCGSKSVKTISEIIGHTCPKCKSSKITTEFIGCIE